MPNQKSALPQIPERKKRLRDQKAASTGDKIRVSGALEKVENIETGEIYYHVVVGTGVHGNEYIEPIDNLAG